MVLIFSYGYNMRPRLPPRDIINITPGFVTNYRLRYRRFLRIDNTPSHYGYANAEESESDCLFGVLQLATPRGLAKLDFQENCLHAPNQYNTYDRRTVRVTGDDGNIYDAFMYIMNPKRALDYENPSARYKSHLLESAISLKKKDTLEHVLSITETYSSFNP